MRGGWANTGRKFLQARDKYCMARPPRLTDEQRKSLKILEPSLRNSARLGDYTTAKQVALEIQKILRPTGHETRLMQSKNWLFEAALEGGEIITATHGFEGVRQKTSPGTRVHLEASALLAICYLRSGDIDAAKPLMQVVLGNLDWIPSQERRRQFRSRVIQRFDEEAAVYGMRGRGDDVLDGEKLQDDAASILSKMNEDEILEAIGELTPHEVRLLIWDIDASARKAIPHHELKYLPNPENLRQQREIGKTVFSSIKITLYRSLCDPESDVYKAWFNEGVGVVVNKKYVGTAVAATLSGFNIGMHMLAVYTAALILRFGIDVYCERYKPASLMIPIGEKN
jgi:hypothetical protein